MRAAAYHGPGTIELIEMSEHQPGTGQVKVKVGFNGV
jgi:(R,R)-butanediol dehydrogenase/meso-butanediol dehydrogenase/diacetyl reductase